MQICLATASGNRIHTIDPADVQAVCKKLQVSESRCEKLLRRNVNILTNDDVQQTLHFFTNNLNTAFHLMLKGKMFAEHPANLQCAIERYETFTNVIRRLPEKLVSAIHLCLENCPEWCACTSPRELQLFLEKQIYPKTDIQVMCFIHQILSRVLSVFNGEVVLTNDTFVDRAVNQIYNSFEFYDMNSSSESTNVIQQILRATRHQMKIWFEHTHN